MTAPIARLDTPGSGSSGPRVPGSARSGWSDLLGSALVGTARGGGDAGALLDAAAAQALRRRAGVALVPAGAPPGPAPGDDRPVVGPAAAARADALLALDRRDATPARDLAGRLELLAEWLAAAAAAGRRLPPELVPELLDAGRRHRQLRPLVAPAAGPLAGWLGAQRADWSYVPASGASAPPSASTAAGFGAPVPSAVTVAPAGAGDDTWEFGTLGHRVAYLGELRRHAPARARELLAAAWDAEPPEHRAALLPVLDTGLSVADEPLLERALDDRRQQVRQAALDLLVRLAGSGYAARMAARARRCVRPLPDRIAIEPPAECDQSMRRDGIVPRPPAGTGERAWWLEQILARTPLPVWPEPHEFLSRPIAGDWVGPVHRGLAQAAATHRDGAWAAALVDVLTAGAPGATNGPSAPGATNGPSAPSAAGADQPADRLPLAALYQALPADELAARAAAAFDRGLDGARAVAVEQLLARCPKPWPPAVAGAVVTALADQLARPGGAGWRVTGLCELAAGGLPARLAPRVAALVERARAARTGSPAAGPRLGPMPGRSGDPVLAAVDRLATILQFRHDMLEELASDQ